MKVTLKIALIWAPIGFLATFCVHFLTFTQIADVSLLETLTPILFVGIFPPFGIVVVSLIGRKEELQATNKRNSFRIMSEALQLKFPVFMAFFAVLQACIFYAMFNFISNSSYADIKKLEDGRMVSMNRSTILQEFTTEEEFQLARRHSVRFMSGHPLVFYLVASLLSFRLVQLSSQEKKKILSG